MEYVKCFLCRQRYCSNCLNNPERLDIGLDTAEEFGWVCPCCTRECCCSYEECHADHAHCFTHLRTLSRHAERKHEWTKTKLVQRRDVISNVTDVGGVRDLLQRLLALQREFNADQDARALKREHVEEIFAQHKRRRLA